MWEIILNISTQIFIAVLLVIIIFKRPGNEENVLKQGIKKLSHKISIKGNSEEALLLEEQLMTWGNPNYTNSSIKSRNLTQ